MEKSTAHACYYRPRLLPTLYERFPPGIVAGKSGGEKRHQHSNRSHPQMSMPISIYSHHQLFQHYFQVLPHIIIKTIPRCAAVSYFSVSAPSSIMRSPAQKPLQLQPTPLILSSLPISALVQIRQAMNTRSTNPQRRQLQPKRQETPVQNQMLFHAKGSISQQNRDSSRIRCQCQCNHEGVCRYRERT